MQSARNFAQSDRMLRRRNAPTMLALATLIVALAHIPDLLRYAARPEGFTGIYFHPDDGSSSLAKMRQGWQRVGAWDGGSIRAPRPSSQNACS